MAYVADALDVLSPAEARSAVGIRSSEMDENLAMAVTAISRLFDDSFGPVVQRTVTNEVHRGFSETVTTDLCPVASFTSVIEAWQTVQTALTEKVFGAADTTDSFWAEPWQTTSAPYSGTLYRIGGGVGGGGFSELVKISYVAGRFASTAVVDRLFKQAAVFALKNAWKAYQDSLAQSGEFTSPFASFPGFALPRASTQLLRGEMRAAVKVGV